MAAEIQKDMRAWPDGAGKLVSRGVATWEECHQVCLELESLKLNSKSLTTFSHDVAGPKAKGKKDRPAGINAQEQRSQGKGQGD